MAPTEDQAKGAFACLTYQAIVDALAGLDYAIRPVVLGGRVPDANGEYQILAYPIGNGDGEAFVRLLVAESENRAV